MPALLDLPAVRRFTDELTADVARCGNGEGMECSTLEAKIRHFVSLCAGLRTQVNEWAKSVFKGQATVDPEIELLYRHAVETLAARAKLVVAEGITANVPCYYLDRLSSLEWHVRDLEYLHANWRTPKLSVAPGPRVPLSENAIAEGLKVIEQMRPLPTDWQPITPEQFEALRRLRASNPTTD